MTAEWTPATARGLATTLLEAHRDGRVHAAADLPLPPTIDAALAVQAAVTAALGGVIEGWKVSRPREGLPIAAPLRPVLRLDRDRLALPWRAGMGLEVEIAFVLGPAPDDTPARPLAAADLAGRIAAIHLGIEITGGRVREGNQAPFTLFLADSLDNAGFILGPALPASILPAVGARAVAIAITGAARWSGQGRHPQDDPLAALAEPLAHASFAALVADGAIITTGSLCGIVPIDAPGPIDIAFGADVRLHLDIT